MGKTKDKSKKTKEKESLPICAKEELTQRKSREPQRATENITLCNSV
jgi:hypothetical protein